jgi:cytochrome c5
MTPYLTCTCALILVCGAAMGASSSKIHEPPSQSVKGSSSSMNSTLSNPGEQVFNANCGRCHMPPMSIAPRVTGTVIMHMRVRARLSREDEQLLLRYLAP